MAVFASIIEKAIGTIDGVNTTFSTSGTYSSGSVFVFYNGSIQPKNYVVELGGTSFRVEDPPLVGDVLQVRYLSSI